MALREGFTRDGRPMLFVDPAKLDGISEKLITLYAQADLSAEFTGGVLTVSGERRSELDEDEVHFYTRERSYGNFRRSMNLPEGVDKSKINASFEDGLRCQAVLEAVEQTIADLNGGRLRVAERQGVGQWTVNQWVKKAVLLSFRLNDNKPMHAGDLAFFDKVPPKFSHLDEEHMRAAQVHVVAPSQPVIETAKISELTVRVLHADTAIVSPLRANIRPPRFTSAAGSETLPVIWPR